MKNLVQFPKRPSTPESNEELRSALVLLREVVEQLAERVEVLEARASLRAVTLPVEA